MRGLKMSNKTITVEYSVNFAHPIETVEYTLTKPEGMSDDEWNVLMEELQGELENINKEEDSNDLCNKC